MHWLQNDLHVTAEEQKQLNVIYSIAAFPFLPCSINLLSGNDVPYAYLNTFENELTFLFFNSTTVKNSEIQGVEVLGV